MASFLSVQAQETAQMPQAQMRSTSGMVYSGSTLPQAAATGAMVTGTTPGTYSPASTAGGGPKHVKKGWGSGGESGEPGDRPEPYEDPLGDAMIPLALCACAYLIMRVVRARRREKVATRR